MDEPPLNPAQHVERIREILIGRQMNQVEQRLQTLEGSVGTAAAPEMIDRLRRSQIAVLEECRELRRDSQQCSEQLARLGQQLDTTCRDLQQQEKSLQTNLGNHLESISAAMASRIDARVREILQHLHGEIVQWKNQVDRDLQGVRDQSVGRSELKSRLARMASAAMADESAPEDGFLL